VTRVAAIVFETKKLVLSAIRTVFGLPPATTEAQRIEYRRLMGEMTITAMLDERLASQGVRNAACQLPRRHRHPA
jgi:hypothetical protein